MRHGQHRYFEVPNNFDGAGHVFWDDIHPTTEMHAIVADRVFAALNEQIPTPVINDNVQNDKDNDNDNVNFTCFIRSSMCCLLRGS